MKWVLDANGNVKLSANKHPVYAADDGSEIELDLPKTLTKISSLFGEAKQHREAKEAAESKLAGFDGLDVTAAKSAIETVKALNGKTALTVAELEKIRTDTAAETKKSLEARYKPVTEENERLKGQIKTSAISAFFASSPFAKEKLAIPADMAQAYFGKHFDVDDAGKVSVKGHDGQSVLSKRNPGSVAEADEAFEILVDGYPNKASILKGSGQGGSGGAGGGRGGSGGKMTMTRSEFDAIQNPGEKAKIAGTHEIVDA